MSGINQPKLVEAHGSDGQIYQLAKACNDDLRQDAVMQQLFGVVNRLLVDDPAAGQTIARGYVSRRPFTPAAGVLEWVDNTTLLSEYLVGGSGGGGGTMIKERMSDIDEVDKSCAARNLPAVRRIFADVRQGPG